MSHDMPVLSCTPKPVSSPRGRYLAALAKAKTAEVEYLAAEAVRREAEVLRHRLEEIQLQKQEQELLYSRYGCLPHYSPRPLMDLDAHPSYGYDSFTPFRHQVEAKEYLRILSVRRAEEARLLSLRQEQEEALAAAFLERQTSEGRHCICHKQLKRALPPQSALLCPAARSFATNKFTPAKLKLQMQPSAEVDVQDLLTRLLVSQAERSKANASFDSRHPTGETPTQPPDILEQFASLFGLSAKEAQKQCTRQASTPSEAVSSLKEKLVSRSNNESSFEVRDTIQAVLSSLQGTESHAAPSSSTASDPVGTYEGKAKAQETPSNTSASDVPPTSQDVDKSMNEVRNIEAAFQDLVTSFTFPPHLDFLATHPVPDSPASSDSEASATTHLAYTSRNRAVRSYEHALNKLLTQLDAVDSFGDDRLRAMRKEVVKSVEKTLEALEGEIEQWWRGNLFQQAEPINMEVTEAVRNETAAVPEQPKTPTSEPAPSRNDSTAVSDISKVTMADKSTAEEDFSTFSPTAEADAALERSTPVSFSAAVTAEAATKPNATQESSSFALAADAADTAPEHSIASASRETQFIAQDTVFSSIEALATDASDSAVSTQPSSTTSTEVSDTENGIASVSPQLDPSALAPKGFDVEATTIEDASPVDLESGEGFLLTTPKEVGPALAHLNNREIEEDAGSDWLEVEA